MIDRIPRAPNPDAKDLTPVNHVQIKFRNAVILWRAGEIDEAEKLLKEAKKDVPTSPNNDFGQEVIDDFNEHFNDLEQELKKGPPTAPVYDDDE